jgi:hypothetical protein
VTTARGPIERDRVAIELGLFEAYEGYEWCRWHRNKRGTTVHRRDCTRRGASLPWFWAQDRFSTDDELLEGLTFVEWTKPCSYCLSNCDKDLVCTRVGDNRA